MLQSFIMNVKTIPTSVQNTQHTHYVFTIINIKIHIQDIECLSQRD